MNKFCALTGEVTDLKASHIIPKFFYADLKKKGGCYFRSTYNPKLEHKDGIKIPLLGNKAELLFSKQEKWFKENVFDYYHNKQKTIIQPIKMRNELFYFSVSLLWRSIHYLMHLHPDNFQSAFNNKQIYDLVIDAEKEWKQYLNGGDIPEIYSNIYIATFDNIISEFSDNADLLFYLKRGCDFGVITDNLDIMINCAFFCKCPNFIFFADLLPSTSGDFEYGYLVNNLPEYEKTTFIEDWTINDNRIIECLFERSDLQKSLIEKNPVSSKAAQQIVSRIKSTPNFKDSELGQLLKMKYD